MGAAVVLGVMCTTVEQQPCSTRFFLEQVEQWGSVWGHVCKWAGSVTAARAFAALVTTTAADAM